MSFAFKIIGSWFAVSVVFMILWIIFVAIPRNRSKKLVLQLVGENFNYNLNKIATKTGLPETEVMDMLEELEEEGRIKKEV